ncbi:unnamed protein product [Bathycoccus prasinos]|jgi:hypothetical protein|tara:strand:+ start:930 stop:2855 length:1926 start_codon:yes stop_codon:yes gene_type:complete
MTADEGKDDDSDDENDAVSDDGFVYAEVEVVSVEGTDSEDEDERRKEVLCLGEEDRQNGGSEASPSPRELTEEKVEDVNNIEKKKKKKKRRMSEQEEVEDDPTEPARVSEEVPRKVPVDDAPTPFVELGIYKENEDQKIQRQTQFTSLANATKTNQDALLLCERLRREIQTHKTHRLRLEQEKREQMKTIKRLKKEAEEVFAPAIEDLNAKYGVAMKDRTMLTIERNKLMKRIKGLEKELEELRDAQTKKKKTKKEEEEEKAKAKAKPTSKVATRVKAIEHKVAKSEEREEEEEKEEKEQNETSHAAPSSALLLKKFKKRQKKHAAKTRVVSQEEVGKNTRREAFDHAARARQTDMFEATKKEEEKKERKHMQTLLSHSQTEQRQEKPRVVNVTHTRLIRMPKSDKDQRFASALHPSKKCIAYGDESGGWRMLDTNTGEVVASFENYAVSTQEVCTSRVTFISFVNTGKILLCGDARGCVSLFDLTLAKRILFFPHSPLVALPSVSLAPSTTCDTAEETLLQPAPPKLDSESTYCVFIKGTGNNGETNSTTTTLEAAKTPAVKGIALSPNESFVVVTYKHSNVFKIFDCCYSMPKELLEENSFLVCEIKTECSPDISSVDFINDTTVIIRDETSAAYRVSF